MGWEDIDTKPSLAHLGITATHVRRIKPGTEYEQYFEPATGENELIMDEATVHDTLDFVKVLVNKTIKDTKKIAQVLKRPTLEATCKSVFDFFYTHYQYKLDDLGVEQVRRPTRAWRDRKTGIDCDCFTASVSSVLTNLGIEHYLKIIAINGKENFQHIYVVVPKRSGLDINSRANYWVIDPVLNNNNEEAPTITKTKHLKMNGIPLQQLNGIDELAGLGNEFEGMEQELHGLEEEQMGRVLRRRLLNHVKNTRAKIRRNPQAISHMYQPQVVDAQMEKMEMALEGVLSGTMDETTFEGVLEHLSAVEHLAVLPHFTENFDAIHGHDDHLYGVLYGDIDDNMLSAVTGLSGKRGRSKAKVKAGKKGKSGFFTKVKNADKGAKKGKFKGKLKNALKKVVRIIKKTSPLAIAARGGFIMAMRTNFAKIAEKAYWGYFTREEAKAKGIPDEYYDACVAVKNKLLKVFVERLGGNENTLKKPIMNGRAAKKIAKLLKAKGMSGTTEQLFGLGSGLGVVAAAGSAATITAAMAFLAPIIKMISGMKGKKSGLEKDENGNDADTTSENADEEMEKTESEARNPKTGKRSSTVDDDGSVEAADEANDEESGDEDSSSEEGGEGKKKKLGKSSSKSAGGNKGLIIAAVAGVGLVAALALKGKKKSGTDGLGNFSAKRESKNLKTKVAKAGLKMPHGYSVEKRKAKKVKTIKI